MEQIKPSPASPADAARILLEQRGHLYDGVESHSMEQHCYALALGSFPCSRRPMVRGHRAPDGTWTYYYFNGHSCAQPVIATWNEREAMEVK